MLIAISSSPALTEREKFLGQAGEYIHPAVLWGGTSFEANAGNVYRNGTLNFTHRNQGDEHAHFHKNSFGVGQPPDPGTWLTSTLENVIAGHDLVSLDMEGDGVAADPDEWQQTPDITDQTANSDYWYHWQLILAIRAVTDGTKKIITDYAMWPRHGEGDVAWESLLPTHATPSTVSLRRRQLQEQSEGSSHYAGIVDAFMPAVYPKFEGELYENLSGANKHKAREYWLARERIFNRLARVYQPQRLYMPIMRYYGTTDGRLQDGYVDSLAAIEEKLYDGFFYFANNSQEGDTPTISDYWVQVLQGRLNTINNWVNGLVKKPARRMRHENAIAGIPETFQFRFPLGTGDFKPSNTFTAYQGCHGDGSIYGIGAECDLVNDFAVAWDTWALEPWSTTLHKVDMTDTHVRFDFTDHQTDGWECRVMLNDTLRGTFSTGSAYSGAGTIARTFAGLEDANNVGVDCGGQLEIL